MMAVVQTGSRIFRSACATKRSVCRPFWAWTDGAPSVITAAAPRTTCRRLMRAILEFLVTAAVTRPRATRADDGPGGYQSFPKPTFKRPIARFETGFREQRTSHLFKTIARWGTAAWEIIPGAFPAYSGGPTAQSI